MLINHLSSASLFLSPIVNAINKQDRLRIAICALVCAILLSGTIYWACSCSWNKGRVQPEPDPKLPIPKSSPKPLPKSYPKPLSPTSPKKNNENLHPVPPISPSILQTPTRKENIGEKISGSPKAKKNLFPLFEQPNPE